MFAVNYALEAANIALELAIDAIDAIDAIGSTPRTSDTLVSIERVEEETVEFNTVDVKTDGIKFTDLDDDDFTLVTAPTGFVPKSDTSDLPTREQAAAKFLISYPLNPTAKNDFLRHSGYKTPENVSDEVAKYVAEACLRERSCQSLKLQGESESATTSSSVLPFDLIDDYCGTPVDH